MTNNYLPNIQLSNYYMCNDRRVRHPEGARSTTAFRRSLAFNRALLRDH